VDAAGLLGTGLRAYTALHYKFRLRAGDSILVLNGASVCWREEGGRREKEGREKGGRREEKRGRREGEGREKGGRREGEGREKGGRREGEGRERRDTACTGLRAYTALHYKFRSEGRGKKESKRGLTFGKDSSYVAIQLALHAKAKVITTVFTPEQKRFLQDSVGSGIPSPFLPSSSPPSS
jgi:hypothetical protein